jgi:hypothetical protein
VLACWEPRDSESTCLLRSLIKRSPPPPTPPPPPHFGDALCALAKKASSSSAPLSLPSSLLQAPGRLEDALAKKASPLLPRPPFPPFPRPRVCITPLSPYILYIGNRVPIDEITPNVSTITQHGPPSPHHEEEEEEAEAEAEEEEKV